MSINERSTVPKIEPKLGGQHNYAEWILSIKQTLGLYDHGDGSIWEIVTGEITDPTGGSEIKAEKSDTKTRRQWKRDNDFAILTMKRNCEPEVVSIIGLSRNAHEAYQELQAKFEGRTVTDLGAVLSNITHLIYDDRKTTIEDHITEFEKRWNFMKSTLAGEFDEEVKEFGGALRKLAGCDRAKADFLLISLPPFYSNRVEKLRSKIEYTYGDISRQIRLYIPARQKGNRTKPEEFEGTREAPVVLKAETKDNGKRCEYCQSKGWRGLNHTKDECFTKKREEKKKEKVSKAKVEEIEGDSDGISIAYIRVRTAGTTFHDNMGHYIYGTGASHSTTNQLWRLSSIREVNLKVKAHDGSTTTCTKIGTLTMNHNGRILKHHETLYGATFSNLISGQRIKDHDVKARGNSVEIKVNGKILYKMTRDDDGAAWIIPQDTGSKGWGHGDDSS